VWERIGTNEGCGCKGEAASEPEGKICRPSLSCFYLDIKAGILVADALPLKVKKESKFVFKVPRIGLSRYLSTSCLFKIK